VDNLIIFEKEGKRMDSNGIGWWWPEEEKKRERERRKEVREKQSIGLVLYC